MCAFEVAGVKRQQPLSGGSCNGCYGKSKRARTYKKAALYRAAF